VQAIYEREMNPELKFERAVKRETKKKMKHRR
jgi:hypothetical protein